jgi:hypothetical protein
VSAAPAPPLVLASTSPQRRAILEQLGVPFVVVPPAYDEVPAKEHLVNPQFGMHRFEWPDGGVEFHLAHGEWIDLLRANGLEVERLIELYAPEGAEDHGYYQYVTAEWASRWPNEEIWVARKRA